MTHYTFDLIDGRKVTYAGKSEKHAFNRAYSYHREAVYKYAGITQHCSCIFVGLTQREAGVLVCKTCAGVLL